MTETVNATWELKQTEESRSVVDALKNEGFERSDAYRYNSASIRVRVIDSRFEGLPVEKRHDLVEPVLEKLPLETQGDIMSLYTFAPSELFDPKRTQPQKPSAWRQHYLNAEFEDPSPSIL